MAGNNKNSSDESEAVVDREDKTFFNFVAGRKMLSESMKAVKPLGRSYSTQQPHGYIALQADNCGSHIKNESKVVSPPDPGELRGDSDGGHIQEGCDEEKMQCSMGENTAKPSKPEEKFCYTRRGFTSEVFKIEIQNIPKYMGYVVSYWLQCMVVM